MEDFKVYKDYKPRVYLAGKYADRDGLMGAKRDQLKELGFEITHDWMTYELPGERTSDICGKYSQADILGVKTADLVIAVMDDPEYAYRGTFCEIGAALALKKTIVVYTPKGPSKCRQVVFWNDPSILHATKWDHVLEFANATLLWAKTLQKSFNLIITAAEKIKAAEKPNLLE